MSNMARSKRLAGGGADAGAIDVKAVARLAQNDRIRFAMDCAATVKSRILGSGGRRESAAATEDAIGMAKDIHAGRPTSGSGELAERLHVAIEAEKSIAARLSMQSALAALMCAVASGDEGHAFEAYHAATLSIDSYVSLVHKKAARDAIEMRFASLDSSRGGVRRFLSGISLWVARGSRRLFLGIEQRERTGFQIAVLCLAVSLGVAFLLLVLGRMERSSLSLVLGIPCVTGVAVFAIRCITELLVAKWKAAAQVRVLAAGSALASGIVLAGVGGAWQVRPDFPWVVTAEPDFHLVLIGLAFFLVSVASAMYLALANDILKFVASSMLVVGAAAIVAKVMMDIGGAKSESPLEVRPRQSLASPDYSGFEFASDNKCMDFRRWRYVSPDRRSARASCVTWTRHVTGKTISADARFLRLSFSTTGLPMDFWCPSHPGESWVEEKAPRPMIHDDLQKTYHVVVDLGSGPPGRLFSVEVRADFWNAFQGDDSSFAYARIRFPTPSLGLEVLLPETRGFKSFDSFVVRKDESEANGYKKLPFEGQDAPRADRRRNSIFWNIVNPEVDSFYKIEWVWEG